MGNYFYKAFGLNIDSEIPLPELLPADGPPEVEIRRQSLAEEFRGTEATSFITDGSRMFGFRLNGLGAFYISDGRSIVVDVYQRDNEETAALYILGTCFGALLMQRRLLPLHGSALALGEANVILCGQSGAGKSSLSSAFMQAGSRLIADDLAALQLGKDNGVHVLPAFPKQKLCRDTAIHMFGHVDGLERIPGLRDKFHVPMNSLDEFVRHAVKLDAVFELSTHEGNQVEVDEFAGAEKLAVLIRNTFRYELVGIKGLQAWHFHQCTLISKAVRVFTIRRPRNGYTTGEQMEEVRKVLGAASKTAAWSM